MNIEVISQTSPLLFQILLNLVRFQQVTWLKEAAITVSLDRNFNLNFIENQIVHHR
jgi:hypothetical protein